MSNLREEIQEWLDQYEYLLDENRKLKSVIEFWRKKWVDQQTIPEKYDDDRKQRIYKIFLTRRFSIDPETDLKEACEVFDSFPRVEKV